MRKTIHTSDSGMTYITTIGHGHVIKLETDDANDTVTVVLRTSEYSGRTLMVHLIVAEIEHDEHATTLQNAYYHNQPVSFEAQWWDTDGTGNEGDGTTIITHAAIDVTQPRRHSTSH
jgi:hypothetical protein